MNELNTQSKIEAALKAIAPDMVDVIKQMAVTRGLDPARLTLGQYHDLIVEEAEASFEPTEPESSGKYWHQLRLIASGIDLSLTERERAIKVYLDKRIEELGYINMPEAKGALEAVRETFFPTQ